MIKGSLFFDGKKEYGTCFASSQVPEPSVSVSPPVSCFQEYTVTREHKMCVSLVSRKGNQEYDPTGVRNVLLHQTADKSGLVETSTELR